MLRDELRKGTELGVAADQLTRKGQLVPDAMITQLVQEWLGTHGDSFVFDGFPRTVPQGVELKRLLQERGTPLDIVLFFDVPFEEIRERVLKRVSCRSCGKIFRVGLQIASFDESCPACGGELFRRNDDTLEALEQRMMEYREKTAPLVSFYKECGLLVTLKAAAQPSEVFSEISSILEAA